MKDREPFKVDTNFKGAPHKFTALGLVVLCILIKPTLLTLRIAYRFPPKAICGGGMVFVAVLAIAESTFSRCQ
jgi:hypothetical protein